MSSQVNISNFGVKYLGKKQLFLKLFAKQLSKPFVKQFIMALVELIPEERKNCNLVTQPPQIFLIIQ